MTKPSVIAVVGPTATGKSELAIRLAAHLDGEVISADSMQIYRDMDIGTGKVPPEQRRVPHHGLDIVDPGEPYSAALFQRYARAAIEDITARGKLPIICGGTGFYVRAALDDFDFPEGSQDENPVRVAYTAMLEEKGAQAVWDELAAIDPESAACIHPNNAKRVIRALELAANGERYADQLAKFGQIDEAIPAIYIGLTMSREQLYARIDARVDEMLSEGLIDEVRLLAASGYETGLTAPQAIGYKEIYASLRGECTIEEAIAAIKQATRRYAKRQMSWFKRDERITWIDVSCGYPAIFETAIDVCRKAGLDD